MLYIIDINFKKSADSMSWLFCCICQMSFYISDMEADSENIS